MKIKVMGKSVKEKDPADGKQLLQEMQASWEAYSAADARWIEKQREIGEGRRRVEGLLEMAKSRDTESALLKDAAAAGKKQADVLSQEAEALDTERVALHRKWCHAAERWEKLRFSQGLPFYDPEMGPPAWFAKLYERRAEPAPAGAPEAVPAEEKTPG